MIPELHIEDYYYNLPPERIAKYPLPERDSSMLLRYDGNNIGSFYFRDLPDLLPSGSQMVFNDTKVVPARLHFRRESGAIIEVFCLQPVRPSEYIQAFSTTDKCQWECVIGNSKRWKNDILSFYRSAPSDGRNSDNLDLKAELISRNGQTGVVEFSWSGGYLFSEVLEICGNIPIPPYLNRDTETIDYERYQTLYARKRGSVAAPTAGLHFTDEVLSRIREKGIDIENICLHVGAGTFLPVKDSEVSKHVMHREPFTVSKKLIEKLISRSSPLVAVGTTSVRTLESLYYIGVSIIRTGRPVDVGQWDPYTGDYTGLSLEDSLTAIYNYLKFNNLNNLSAGTRIIIVPGFKFRLVDMLVTNFHQSESTLILLVSAFLEGKWKTVYDYALANDYRFLSYGDSSLLIRQ